MNSAFVSLCVICVKSARGFGKCAGRVLCDNASLLSGVWIRVCFVCPFLSRRGPALPRAPVISLMSDQESSRSNLIWEHERCCFHKGRPREIRMNYAVLRNIVAFCAGHRACSWHQIAKRGYSENSSGNLWVFWVRFFFWWSNSSVSAFMGQLYFCPPLLARCMKCFIYPKSFRNFTTIHVKCWKRKWLFLFCSYTVTEKAEYLGTCSTDTYCQLDLCGSIHIGNRLSLKIRRVMVFCPIRSKMLRFKQWNKMIQ